MEAWAWLIAYLVGFALLQLVLYRYFQRGESTHDNGERDTRESGYQRLERSAMSESAIDRSADDTDGVYCKHCGARNERDGMYSYCRNCAEPLR